MSRRTTGVMLLAVAAMLHSARYLSAAIFGSGISSWDADLFNAMLQYVGTNLSTWSAFALAGGLFYLVWAEVEVLWLHNKELDIDRGRRPK